MASPNNTYVDDQNHSLPRAVPKTRTRQRTFRPRCTRRPTNATLSGSGVQCGNFFGEISAAFSSSSAPVGAYGGHGLLCLQLRRSQSSQAVISQVFLKQILVDRLSRGCSVPGSYN